MNQAEPIGNANEGVSLGSQLLPGHLVTCQMQGNTFVTFRRPTKNLCFFLPAGQDRRTWLPEQNFDYLAA